MKNFTGYLRKMEKSIRDRTVDYNLVLANYKDEKENSPIGKCDPEIDIEYSMNSSIGRTIRLEFSGGIRCVDCGRPTKKSFNQGSCYVCFTKLASNDYCILKPSQCHFHKGSCREPEWGKKNCFQNHTVYLAITSGPKVGITKEKKPINRWIDQGAVLAIPMLTTQSRLESGIIEDFIGQYISDKTSWQKMVTGNPDTSQFDLTREREKFLKALDQANLTFEDENAKKNPVTIKPSLDKPTEIHYPIAEFPKAKSIKPTSDKPIEGKLLGIKGQYLLMDIGVINLRTYQGYKVIFSMD